MIDLLLPERHPGRDLSPELIIYLDGLLKTEDGWDGGSAPAPTVVAVEMMKLVYQRLDLQGRKYDDSFLFRLSADVDGGLVLTIRRDECSDRCAIISCPNEGDVFLILEDRASKAPMVVSINDMDDHDLSEMIDNWLPNASTTPLW